MSVNTRMRVLLVDDEEFNRVRLRDLLTAEPDVEIVGEATDGVEAVEQIRALRPDLVFLDIRMPGISGLDVVQQIGPSAMPVTVFVTAYDEHAVEAFRLAALDFLVKPFDDDRFVETLQRARKLVVLNDLATMRARLMEVLGAPGASGGETPNREVRDREAVPGGYLERIAVEAQGTIKPVSVSEIDYILASGPYAELVVAGRRHLVRESMQSLEDRLDPRRFLRIHRSVIVRLDRAGPGPPGRRCHRAGFGRRVGGGGFPRGAGGEGEVLLKGGGRLRVSRTRREALERWLGLVS